jgi:hypothetical protein
VDRYKERELSKFNSCTCFVYETETCRFTLRVLVQVLEIRFGKYMHLRDGLFRQFDGPIVHPLDMMHVGSHGGDDAD